MTLPENDLTDQIFIMVRSKNIYDEKDDKKDLTKVKVKLTDQLQKVVDLITDGASGQFFASGKAITDLEQTVEKVELHEGQQIFVIATVSGGQPKQWRRFKNFHDSDYCCLERDYLDAVIFKPKRDIVFYGYGVFSSYFKRDFTVKCGWEIEDERSEMHQITF